MNFYETMPKITQLFLMDCFGGLLGVSSEKGLVRVPFSSRQAGEVFCLSLYPLEFPARIELRLENAFPENIPEMEMVSVTGGFVALKSFQNNKYMASNPHDGSVFWKSHRIFEWERYLPLTRENFHALLRLARADMAEIRTLEGDVLEALKFNLMLKPFGPIGSLNGFLFPIANNLEEITKIHALTEGQVSEITLKNLKQEEKRFLITGKKASHAF